MSFMNEKGSVTVYALLIMLPILLMMGFLLDIVRYHAIEAQAEKTVKAAASSVLSAYDRTLRQEYGLFGLAANEQQRAEIAGRVIGGYGTAAQKVSVEVVYALADHRFFRRQVMEEMKLKAPIEFTRHAYGKWKGMEPHVEQASEQFQLSEDTEKLLMRREGVLRDAFAVLERMNGLMNEGRDILSRPRTIAVADEEGKIIVVPVPNPYADAYSTFAKLQSGLDELRGQLNQAQDIERQIQSVLEAHTEQHDLFDGIHLFGYSYYKDYELGVSAPIAMFGASVQAANADSNTPVDMSFHASFMAYMAQRRSDEAERRGGYDKLEAQKREQRQKTATQLEQVKETLAQHVCGIEDEQHYLRLSEYFQRYIEWNTDQTGAQSDLSPAAALDQKPEQLQKSSLTGLVRLTNVLRDIRDEAYINEYVMLYFNHRVTSRQQQPMITNVKSHLLQDQEVEYILYGLPTCTGNRAAAYAELYTVRFAVRTIEALLDARKAAGSPMLMLLTAAAEGAVKAYQDMAKLLQGEEVPIFSKYPALKMGYGDYMRLFMAIHSKELNKMSRIQALIQLNTGSDLRERPVYVRLESSTPAKMWMMPAVSSALLGAGKEDGALTISKQGVMAY